MSILTNVIAGGRKRSSFITNGLLGWWKFDEGAGTSTTADSSGNGNVGTLNGSPTWVAGKIGNALSFNGSSQSVTFTRTSGYTTFTIAAWIKIIALNTTYEAMFSDTSAATMNLGIHYNVSSYWSMYDGAATHDDLDGNASLTPNLVIGTWVHVAIVCSGSTCQFYVNGVADGSTFTLNNPLFFNSLGSDLATPRYLNAAMDDARIYNRALSATEMNEIASLKG